MNAFNRRKVAAILAAFMLFAQPASICAEELDHARRLDACYSLASASIGTEDYETAKAYIAECMSIIGEDAEGELAADLHLKLGCIHTIEENYDAALVELNAAIAAQEDLSDAYLVRAQVYSAMQRYAEAADSLGRYVELSGDTEKNETLAQLYEMAGNNEEALNAYGQNEGNADLSETEAAYNLGVYKVSMQMYDEAIPNFEECVNDPTYGVAASYNLGICLMQTGDFARALTAFEFCNENGADYEGLYYNLGVCRMTAGQLEGANEAFTVSIERESFTHDAHYNRGVVRMNLGLFSEAAEDFTAYLDGEKASNKEFVADQATYNRAICYMSVSDFDSAAKDFTSCIRASINSDDSLFNRALSYLQGGEYEKAITDFTKCIKNGNDADEATFYRHYAYRYFNQPRNAIKDLTTCIQNGFNTATCYYERAQINRELGKEDEYLADLKASLEQ